MKIRIEIGPLETSELEQAAEIMMAVLEALPDSAPTPVVMFVDDEEE